MCGQNCQLGRNHHSPEICSLVKHWVPADSLASSRISHRIRDMQQLPYVVVTNPNINEVYDLYYNAFDTFRKIKEIKTLEDNDRFCKTIRAMLKAHLTVIPKLAMGVLQSSELMGAEELDNFMNTILKAVR